eukprot:m.7130 g.7130  ORF g.7130 m.7130 type:complete len:129 (-) comp5660_c0_seq1:2089-2475(-)
MAFHINDILHKYGIFVQASSLSHVKFSFSDFEYTQLVLPASFADHEANSFTIRAVDKTSCGTVLALVVSATIATSSSASTSKKIILGIKAHSQSPLPAHHLVFNKSGCAQEHGKLLFSSSMRFRALPL